MSGQIVTTEEHENHCKIFKAFKIIIKDNYNDYKQMIQNTTESYKKLALEEFERFYSISTIIIEQYLEAKHSIDRDISHTLLRSLFETFIKIFYIFEGADEAERQERYERHLNSFKKEYISYYDCLENLEGKAEVITGEKAYLGGILAPLKQLLSFGKCLPDIKKICEEISKKYETTLNQDEIGLKHLYFYYKMMCFYTHGNMSSVLFRDAFGNADFHHVKREIINLIASNYLKIFQNMTQKS